MNKSKVTDELKTPIMELSQQGQTIRNSATIIKEKFYNGRVNLHNNFIINQI